MIPVVRLMLLLFLTLSLTSCRDRSAPPDAGPDGTVSGAPRDSGECRSLLTEAEVARMRERGLRDPVEDLAADLMSRPELIPYEGVLGGTMGFHSREEIVILTSEWVLARFDDGHIQGALLLRYEVDDEGRISWEVIDSGLL